jgi:hypothetical protein
MPYIAGTGVPTAVTAVCPRCRTARQLVSVGPEVGYLCTGCEWPVTFGAGTPTVSTNASVTTASAALPFASGGTAFSRGQVLFVNDGASSEVVVVNGTVTATSVPVADFDFPHNSGVAVSLAVATPTLPGQDKIPPLPPWGF